MDNVSFNQNSAANHILQLQHFLPAITYGSAPGSEAQAVGEKRLIPAITYGPEPELRAQTAEALPEREVILVDGKEAAIMQMADNIEKECYRKAMATCPEGIRPAVYEVNGETERESDS